jgi:uncharacterized protein YbgA (DUF1722 family)/uncharacterized protein YbbK (DUF523 family)
VGVSACLLGQEVRFDGQHKRDQFVVGELARFVELVPVCPEVEAGMGVPREPVRLVRKAGGVHMLGTKSEQDFTDVMRETAARRVAALVDAELSGYVLKKDSPSCGLERVRVYGASGGPPRRDGRGLFAEALIAAMPLLPVEEEGRLHDPRLRESFVERVFAYRRVRALFARRFTMGELVAFHTAEKLLLLAHDEPAYRALGKLVARAKQESRAGVALAYQTSFMTALARPATTRTHTNVLQHMAGYLKALADDADRRELAEAIHDYRRGLVPLVVPLTLIKHHVRRHGVAYLAGQSYLEPHPKELMLRNHV